MKFFGVVLALALGLSAAFQPMPSFATRTRMSPIMSATAGAKVFPNLPASVKPGVVTGQALVDLLQYAKDNEFAIPGVNIVGAFTPPVSSRPPTSPCLESRLDQLLALTCRH